MIRFRFALLALVILLGNLFIPTAFAADIPIFTWERGRIQQMVLGETKRGTNWEVTLVGEFTEPVRFKSSAQNESGYYVFTAEIPNTLPVGSYSLQAKAPGSPAKIIAGINLIEAKVYDIRRTGDLTVVIGLLTFIMITFSTLRALKYSRLTPISTNQFNLNSEKQNSQWNRILHSALAFRERVTNGVNPSLLRFLLSQESNLLSRYSKSAYYAIPLLGAILGIISGFNIDFEGGIKDAEIFFFFSLVMLGLIDSFSGIVSLFGFWIVKFYFGDISNLNSLLLIVAVAIVWIGPSLISYVYQDAIEKDLKSSRFKFDTKSTRAIAALGAGTSAAGIFFGGEILIQSLVGNTKEESELNILFFVIVGVVAAVKAFLVSNLTQKEVTGENFELVRVASPQIAFATFFLVLGFAYTWTESLIDSLIVASLFATPLLFIFLRFESLAIDFFGRFRRSIVLESTLAVLASLIVFRQVENLPLLSDRRSEIYLMAAAVPCLLHAIYSSICDSAQRKGRIPS